MQTIRGQLRLRMPGLTACLRTHWLFPIVSPVLLSFLHKRPELRRLKPQLPKAIQSFVHNNNNNNNTALTKTGKQTRPRPNDLAPSQRFLGGLQLPQPQANPRTASPPLAPLTAHPWQEVAGCSARTPLPRKRLNARRDGPAIPAKLPPRKPLASAGPRPRAEHAVGGASTGGSIPCFRRCVRVVSRCGSSCHRAKRARATGPRRRDSLSVTGPSPDLVFRAAIRSALPGPGFTPLSTRPPLALSPVDECPAPSLPSSPVRSAQSGADDLWPLVLCLWPCRTRPPFGKRPRESARRGPLAAPRRAALCLLSRKARADQP